MNNHVRVGIDAGGTLIKVVCKEGKDIRFSSFPVSRMEECTERFDRYDPETEICLTGGKASLLRKKISEKRVSTIGEFAASCSGARFLLREQYEQIPEAFILTNVGTGTSIHFVEGEKNSRISGTGVGGGTIIGLSGLLTGVHDFNQMMELAKLGKRNHVDLTVAHIYEGYTPPIPGDLTASNFGLVSADSEGISDSDKIASVIGLVAETVTTMSVLAAENKQVDTVVYIGSSFVGNPALKEVVTGYSTFRGTTPIIPERGQYSGAIGALLSLETPG
ncbi:type II pantothenate kinase [Sporolactobacillus sp. THM7-4]|nr:type II pantothenate kinase [Sporolactobacillus sp. THM7-4]